MNAAIISLGSESSKWTAEAMRKYFDEVDEINIKHLKINFSGKKEEILYNDAPLKHYDCIYAKGSFRFGNLLSALTTLLNKSSFMPLSSSSFTVANDKLLTQLALHSANIPMPKTFLSSSIAYAKSILKQMTYPIIMKFPKGTQGKGVMFADSYASASSILDALSVLNQPVIIQEYIETNSTDLRAIVVGGKVVAAYRRIGVSDEKRANFHQGGRGEAVQLDEETKNIAVFAARAIKADICGVDILESSRGPLVIEVNISPGLQGVTRFTKIDVADKIAKFLFDKTKKLVSERTNKNASNLLTSAGIDNISDSDSLITSLEVRSNRIILPKFVTNKTKFFDGMEVKLTCKENKLNIEKF